MGGIANARERYAEYVPDALAHSLPAALLSLLLFSCATESRAKELFGLDDYFAIQTISEVAISADGQWIAYAIEHKSLQQDTTIRRVYALALRTGSKAVELEGFSDAHSLAWIGMSHRIAFLSSRYGIAQVVSLDLSVMTPQQETHAIQPIVAYAYAPTGDRLAYVTVQPADRQRSLYNRLRNSNHGVVIDTDTTFLYQFIDPDRDSIAPEDVHPPELWLQTNIASARRAAIPGDPSSMHWSSDGQLLAVNYVSRDVPPSLLKFTRTSIGIVDAVSDRYRSLSTAYAQDGNGPWTYFLCSAWIPGTHTLLIQRIVQTDPWESDGHPQWATAVASDHPLDEKKQTWHPVDLYGGQFFPISESRILVRNFVTGRGQLFEWTQEGQRPTSLSGKMSGSSSLFALSRNRRIMVFVNESLSRPPEIFLVDGNRVPRQLTHLNDDVASKRLPGYKEITWTSKDGVIAHGWLLTPAIETKQPWPVVTFVHGGPKGAFPDMFAFYFAHNIWPYPLEVYANAGIAVFMPNYRGSSSFGRDFGSPKSADGEPLDDVVTGIHALVDSGVADPGKLAIAGHSHGAWLGSLVMARDKVFQVASFAEGWSNEVASFEVLSGQLNREVDDVEDGADLYDAPERYLQLSPDLQFKDVRTAVLLESGSRSLAVLMLGYGKAARHFGLPSESIVYPNTTHTMAEPAQQKESATLNFDWLRFWLKGEEDKDGLKAEQYKRWDVLRASFEERR